MTEFTLKFSLDIFRERARPVIRSYLLGKITASEAFRELGWSRAVWEKHMAGVFSVALGSDQSLASIQEAV